MKIQLVLSPCQVVLHAGQVKVLYSGHENSTCPIALSSDFRCRTSERFVILFFTLPYDMYHTMTGRYLEHVCAQSSINQNDLVVFYE